MFACIYRIKDQKALYFSLNRIITSQFNESKLSGIYAIYKNDLCLYVGQSSNLASRLSTHLSGKYNTVDRIEIFENYEGIEDITPSEKYLIKHLKPMENVIANFTEEISGRIMVQFDEHSEGLPLRPTFEILVNINTLFIHNFDIADDISTSESIKEILLKNIL